MRHNTMEKGYRYIGVGGNYFCVQQSVILLARMLFSSSGRARFAALAVAPTNILTAIIKISLDRLGAPRRAKTLTLPYFGNVCRPVHGAHKLFDFRRGFVIKCFSSQLAQGAVEREIATVAVVGRLDFTPDLNRYHVVHRWYEETFIGGNPGVKFYGAHNSDFWPRYHSAVAPLLGYILRIKPLTRVRLGSYVDSVMGRLETALNKPDRAPELAAMVLEFAADYLEDDLHASRETIITLGFSHGDFNAGNFLKTRDKTFVIDWECAGRRSVRFDLYSFLFGELHKGRAAVLAQHEIDRALEALELMLKCATSAPSEMGALASAYRKIFYLERLLVLAERRLPDPRALRVIVRTIETFTHHE